MRTIAFPKLLDFYRQLQPTHSNQKKFSELEKIISPFIIRDFLNLYWRKKAIKIDASNGKNFDNLLSWEQLQQVLTDCPDYLIRSCNNSLPKSEEKSNMLEQWNQGQTLFISRLETLLPTLEEFSQQIGRELKASTRMYAVCSHPNRPGAQLHCDRFDIFILQIQGKKKWQVQWTKETKPYLECVLSPGDVLYLPTGHWHFAVATDEPSLHLSLGVSFKNFTEKLPEELVLYQTKSKIINKLDKIKNSKLFVAKRY